MIINRHQEHWSDKIWCSCMFLDNYHKKQTNSQWFLRQELIIHQLEGTHWKQCDFFCYQTMKNLSNLSLLCDLRKKKCWYQTQLLWLRVSVKYQEHSSSSQRHLLSLKPICAWVCFLQKVHRWGVHSAASPKHTKVPSDRVFTALTYISHWALFNMLTSSRSTVLKILCLSATSSHVLTPPFLFFSSL